MRSLRAVLLTFRGFGDVYIKASCRCVDVIFVRMGGIFVGDRASG